VRSSRANGNYCRCGGIYRRLDRPPCSRCSDRKESLRRRTPSGGSFRALCGGGAARNGALIGSFGSDPFLNIRYVRGEIVERLDCLPVELQGHGWQPFVARESYDVTRVMVQDLLAGQPGRYDIRAQARCGEPVLYVRIRTLVARSSGHAPGVFGALDLLHADSRRTIILPAGTPKSE